MTITVDPPARLPVPHLSVSSMKLYLGCPLSWKRRYLDGEYEPSSGKMVLGSAAGAAEAQHYSTVIETGEGFSAERVLDEFADEWEDRIGREEIAWGADKPGDLKDSGARALERYHLEIAPQVVPVSVEREFRLWWPGLDWDVTGFLDLEDAEGGVDDVKMRGRRLSSSEADVDVQPGMYLLARRSEGNPASVFRFHTMVRGAKLPFAEVVPTVRTDAQLDALVDRIFMVATEIAWRAENDVWQGAVPGFWKCGPKFCGHHASCRFGGAR